MYLKQTDLFIFFFKFSLHLNKAGDVYKHITVKQTRKKKYAEAGWGLQYESCQVSLNK